MNKIIYKCMNKNASAICKSIKEKFGENVKCISKEDIVKVRVMKPIDYQLLANFPVEELSIYTDNPITHLPATLELLKIENEKYNYVLPDHLPENLEVLIIGDGFNKPLPIIPKNLKMLQLGNSFNQTLKLSDAKNLSILTLGNSFNQPIKYLPDRIKKLVIKNPNYIHKLPLNEMELELIETINVYGLKSKNEIIRYMKNDVMNEMKNKIIVAKDNSTLPMKEPIELNSKFQKGQNNLEKFENMIRNLKNANTKTLSERKDFTEVNKFMDALDTIIDKIIAVKLTSTQTESFNELYNNGQVLPWISNPVGTTPEVYSFLENSQKQQRLISFHLYRTLFDFIVISFYQTVKYDLNESEYNNIKEYIVVNKTLGQKSSYEFYNFFNSFFLQLTNLLFEKKYKMNELSFEYIKQLYEREKTKYQPNIPFEVYSIYTLLGRHIKFFLLFNNQILQQNLIPKDLFYYSVLDTSFEDFQLFLKDLNKICTYYASNMNIFAINPYFIQFFNFVQFMVGYVKNEIFRGVRIAKDMKTSTLDKQQLIALSDLNNIFMSFVHGENFAKKISREISETSLQITRNYKKFMLQDTFKTSETLEKDLGFLRNLMYRLSSTQKELQEQYKQLQELYTKEITKTENFDVDFLQEFTQLNEKLKKLTSANLEFGKEKKIIQELIE